MRTDTRWMEQGLCRQIGTDLFFPEDNTLASRKIRRICQTCPVVAECLAYATDSDETLLGIWGGTTEWERRTLRRERRHAA